MEVIIRSNSSPTGWSNNFIKSYIFKKVLGLANAIIVNSYAFRNELGKKFKVKPICIYNPLNKHEIIKKSKKKILGINFSKKKQLKIINVGRFTEQKDHLTLLKALNNLKNKINFESKIGFTFALELVIKSYLLKLKIVEIPSSWIELKNRKSNFKMIKWLPHYIYWLLYAMTKNIFKIK